MSAALALGFDDPPLDAQRVFRAVMNALARPGAIQALATTLVPPAPLTSELAAVALALVDHEAPLWLDAALAREVAVTDYLKFHTGAAIVTEPGDASFALIADATVAPSLDAFTPGVPEYPDRSTTIVFAVRELANVSGLTLEGPGIAGRCDLRAAPLPGDFRDQLSRNALLFPLGVDCLFTAPGRIAGLPRTTRIVAEAA